MEWSGICGPIYVGRFQRLWIILLASAMVGCWPPRNGHHTTDGGSMAPVVGVHGIWNIKYWTKASGQLAAAEAAIDHDWSDWFARGLGKLDITIPVPSSLPVAYYADCLDRGIPQGDDPGLLPPLAQELLMQWVAELRDQRSPDGKAREALPLGYPTWPVRQAADWLTRRFGEVSCRVVMTLVAELATYFDPAQSHRRTAARERVAEAVRKHRPRVVVAHSLGSVVAYEALCSYRDLRMELLVTMGSPLAIPKVVFDRLDPKPAHERAVIPPGVPRWINIADVGDPVAVPPGRLRDFFDGVNEEVPVRIGAFDPHTARSYLACAELGAMLAPYL